MSKHPITTDALERLSQQIEEVSQLLQRTDGKLEKMQFHLKNTQVALRKLGAKS